MSLAPGTKLGPYRVLTPLGSGGMGEVYRAEDERLGRAVAVKVLPETARENPEALARFEREARAVAALSHPNIVEIFDVGTADGVFYVVTECLTGETLQERLARGTLRQEEAEALSRQILSGLAVAHSRGIIHRDIKPANIFLTGDGRVKILDFGVARIAGSIAARDDEVTAEQAFRTSTGVVLGTVSYMAPEQLRGQLIDPRADIFSFGCLLYEMVTGQRPFAADTPMAVAAKVLGEEPAMDRVPPHFRPVVARCMEKDREKRFASAGDVERSLQTSSWSPRWRTTGAWKLATAAILAVLIAVLAGNAIWKTRSPDEGRAARGSSAVVAVAVLPFANLSGNPADEYLSDGLTDELINALGTVQNLRIPGRTSSFEFKGKRVSLPEVAEKLKVQHAIEGSVQRSGDRIRIRAQLVTVPDGYQVWSESYDGILSDLFGVQNRIAHAIAAKLRESGGSAISTPRTLQSDIDPEAYRLYLQGRHLADRWSRENFGQALASYREAIRREPEFAAAYAALAELYSLVDHRPALMDIEPSETYRLGIQFATQALRIDPHCAEALAALGHIYVHTGEFAEAERHLLAALRSNPNSSQATLWYAVLLNVTNRREEAREQRAKAVELEPLSVQTSVVMMAAANRDGDFEDAVAIGRSTVALLPDSTEPWVFLAVNLAFMGRFAEAHVALSRAAANGAPARVLDAERVRVLALEGRNEEARELLVQIERDPARKPAPVVLMRAWATMDVDRALFWMDEMMRESPDYARVNLTMPPHPLYRELRRHPRYREARRQLGLPLLEDGTR